MEVRINNLDSVTRSLNRTAGMWFDAAKVAFQKATLNASNKTKDNATGALKVRSGHLRQSINQEVTGTNIQTLKASVFSASVVGGAPVVYAPIHEFGGTIQAIDKYLGVPGGPYLNIPTTANKTAAGVTRLQAREVFNQGGYIVRMRSGKYGVFSNGELMFTLVNRVEIPARLGMRDAADEQIPTLLSELADLRAWWMD
jgi:phage gpG-like protein